MSKTPPKPDWMGDDAVFIPDTGWYWVDPGHILEVKPREISLADIKADLDAIKEKLGV